MMGLGPDDISYYVTQRDLSNLIIDDCEIAPQCSKFMFVWNGIQHS